MSDFSTDGVVTGYYPRDLLEYRKDLDHLQDRCAALSERYRQSVEMCLILCAIAEKPGSTCYAIAKATCLEVATVMHIVGVQWSLTKGRLIDIGGNIGQGLGTLTLTDDGREAHRKLLEK